MRYLILILLVGCSQPQRRPTSEENAVAFFTWCAENPIDCGYLMAEFDIRSKERNKR
jgi:hypothetical protein